VTQANVPDLLKLLDEERADMAVVSSLESIMYRNVQKGNELLAERIKGHTDRLIGAAVVNPVYAEAVEDTELCITSFGMKAIRLYPNYHGYTLSDERVGAVVSVAQKHGVPVSIAFRVEDERQRHWLINTPEVCHEEALSLVKSFPEVHFVMERAKRNELYYFMSEGSDAANWYADISGRFLGGALSGPHETIRDLGPDRALFGSDIPLQYAKPVFLKLESTELDKASMERIMGENAARLLNI
jgi:predicted TIM-barrel fold metal-dependent hydrolase